MPMKTFPFWQNSSCRTGAFSSSSGSGSGGGCSTGMGGGSGESLLQTYNLEERGFVGGEGGDSWVTTTDSGSMDLPCGRSYTRTTMREETGEEGVVAVDLCGGEAEIGF
jgi:hypothetical protein